MITCSQCHQQNPIENRFCQYCGASLLVPCPHCHSQVSPVDTECEHCGGSLVPHLIGIVVQGEAELLSQATHIDTQKRYAIASSSEADGTDAPSEYLLLDGHPEELSYLEQVLEQEADNLQTLVATDKEGLNNPQLWLQMGIPAIARHYLSLQEIALGFPAIRDAWVSLNHHVLVLDKPKNLTSFTTYLDDSTSVYDQVLPWLFQMARMWKELEPLRCCQSLLTVENLFLDEDENITLERLIEDDPLTFPTLFDLTGLWEDLFDFGSSEDFSDLQTLIKQLQDAKANNVADLITGLKALSEGETAEVNTIIQPSYDLDDDDDDWANRSEFQDDDEEETEDDADKTEQIEEALIPTAINMDRMEYTDEEDEQPTVVLPMHLLNLEEVGLSDIGSQRDHNEDYFGIQTQMEKQENLLGRQVKARGLYIVCDGMGGHAAGEVTSALSVENLQNYFKKHWQEKLPDEETIKEGIWQTNQKIYDINLKNARSGSGRMGTTLVMALVQDNKVAIAHVGDSRIYRISRKWDLEQLTTDHEVGQREIKKGVEPDIAYGRSDAYQLTQAIGPRDNSFVSPDVQFFEINEDSLFLLCSDGLSDNSLLETSWEQCLLPLLSSRANLDQGVKDLIDLANEHNGHDNITAVLVRVKVRPNLSAPPVM